MKILLTSIGTRGDIEPFLAIGAILENEGHQIVYSFPEQFSSIIPEKSCFHPLSSKVIELIESNEGKALMGKASMRKKINSLLYLYRQGKEINKELIIEQFEIVDEEKPDLIIHNAKCSYPTLWALKHNKPRVLLSPVPYFMHYVKGHSHVGFYKNFGGLFNKLTYALSNYGLTKSIYDGQKSLPERYTFQKSVIKKKLLTGKIIFSISPSLFPRPVYWPNNAQVLGYYHRHKAMHWQPDNALEGFLQRHTKIVFLTFGSMINTNPKQNSKILYEYLKTHNIPTIVNIASGGLVELNEFRNDENFHFVKSIPYEWIFKKVYAVIHHGGSGTTHTAIKYGCVSLILPHIIDQFAWNQLIQNLRIGPKGISINKLNANNLNNSIHSLYHKEEFKNNAEKLSLAMQTEDLKPDLLKFIEKEAI
jgi:UDP:flavonoid glycosyltransferase YjiC (YdhE family)